jgi:hypothetical protein
VNQGPRGYCLMKKNEGQKSRDTVPLNSAILENISTRSRFPSIILLPQNEEIVSRKRYLEYIFPEFSPGNISLKNMYKSNFLE